MAETSIADLVAKLPDTDVEKDSKAPRPSGKAAPPASKFTGPAPREADALVEAVVARGGDALRELIGLVRDPASPDFQGYKAEYLLHCVVLAAGRPDKEAARKSVVAALAAQAADDRAPLYVRGFAIRELQWVADAEAAAALGGILSDSRLSADAAAALAVIGGEAAARQLRAAWPKAKEASRATILHALASVCDGSAKDSDLGVFRAALALSDVNLRLIAAWALARAADARSADALLKLADAQPADNGPSTERVKAASACLLLAERLVAAGNKEVAAEVYRHLRSSRQAATEQHVRDAAERALAALEG